MIIAFIIIGLILSSFWTLSLSLTFFATITSPPIDFATAFLALGFAIGGYFISRNLWKRMRRMQGKDKIEEFNLMSNEIQNSTDEQLIARCEKLYAQNKQIISRYKKLDAQNKELVIRNKELISGNENKEFDSHKVLLTQCIENRKELGSHLLGTKMQDLQSKMTIGNYGETKKELLQTIKLCRDNNVEVTKKTQKHLISILKSHHNLLKKQEASKIVNIFDRSSSKNADEVSKNRNALAKKLINDTMRELKSKMTANNYATSKQKLVKVIDLCRSNNVDIATLQEEDFIAELKLKYEDVLRKNLLKEEQKRIKEKIREEQRFEKERQRELKRVEAEQKAIEDALAKALKKHKDQHSEEVERLRIQLQEAQERSTRAKSQAQLTKAGYVYVISNIGSFGESVFKVGMTRRLEPLDRVKELGDASVPFSFDVHMLISCEDAPALENALHKDLRPYQMNKVNVRKEFFKVSIDEIVKLVEKHHGTVDYIAEPEALEYYESASMTDEDYDFISEEKGALSKLD